MNSKNSQYLQTTAVINCDHPAVLEFAGENAGGSSDPVEQAVKFYRATRDGIRYDPYLFDLSVEGLRASGVLEKGRGWCVPKSILLVACCRIMGIPARLGFADVKNHLSTERMRKAMGTDIFFWHGYASILLNGVWLKVTPAFNKELCERFRFKPLDFDGRGDALFQPFDSEGNKHMEYVRYRGEFADAPINLMRKTFRREYDFKPSWNASDFNDDVERETSALGNSSANHDPN